MRTLACLLIVILTAVSGPALADQVPKPGADDPRIQTVDYDPDQVVLLRGMIGYQLMLEFGPDERIENVSIGNSLAWQVTPNKRADRLFLKPVTVGAATNMTVVTDLRRYAFELTARGAMLGPPGDIPYVVRFIYPPDPEPVAVGFTPAGAVGPERRNTDYTYTGSRASLPSLVFDDGQFTYFQWPQAAATPALFLLAADGSESIANYAMRDGFLVVEQVAPRFVLRNGAEVTTVINNGYRAPSPGRDAPRPHDARTAREAAKVGAHP